MQKNFQKQKTYIMSNENVWPEQNDNTMQDEKNKEKPLPFHNPLNPNDHREITQEDIENEEKFKEALSERD